MHIAQARALIRWDGSTEDIVMELGLDGKTSEAAWFLPVPSRATLKLGNSKLFDTLQEMTKPVVRVEKVSAEDTMTGAAGGTEGGGAPPVTLLERQALGPFDVSTLAATDASALSDWLGENGYEMPQGLPPMIQPYIEQGWYYLAVRLIPGQGETLTGKLDPLWVSFKSEQIIYPMRVMKLAELPHPTPSPDGYDPYEYDLYAPNYLPMFLYVLADHRVKAPESVFELANPEAYGPADEADYRQGLLKYADWVEPEKLEAGSPLLPLVPRKLFLTKFQIDLEDPSRITDDFLFSFDEEDESYRDVEIQYEYVESGSSWLPMLLAFVGGVVLLFLLLGVRLGLRR